MTAVTISIICIIALCVIGVAVLFSKVVKSVDFDAQDEPYIEMSQQDIDRIMYENEQ